MGGRPVLLESSHTEGPFGGGTTVWLRGENFAGEVHIFFGDFAARDVDVCSPQLIKCVSPPAREQRRHQVAIQARSSTNGVAAERTLPFMYVTDGPGGPPQTASLPCQVRCAPPPFVLLAAHADAPFRASSQPEVLERLLASLERSQAAAAAGAATSGLSVFSTVDEHGLSLAEYMRKMRLAVTGATYQPQTMEDASELQMQHQELAAMMTRERLAVGLDNRLSYEQLQLRNILPVAEAEQQLAAKRKRLEGFLAGRPPAPEFLQPQQLSPRSCAQPHVAAASELR
jgi:hypothetical protein